MNSLVVSFLLVAVSMSLLVKDSRGYQVRGMRASLKCSDLDSSLDCICNEIEPSENLRERCQRSLVRESNPTVIIRSTSYPNLARNRRALEAYYEEELIQMEEPMEEHTDSGNRRKREIRLVDLCCNTTANYFCNRADVTPFC